MNCERRLAKGIKRFEDDFIDIVNTLQTIIEPYKNENTLLNNDLNEVFNCCRLYNSNLDYDNFYTKIYYPIHNIYKEIYYSLDRNQHKNEISSYIKMELEDLDNLLHNIILYASGYDIDNIEDGKIQITPDDDLE